MCFAVLKFLTSFCPPCRNAQYTLISIVPYVAMYIKCITDRYGGERHENETKWYST